MKRLINHHKIYSDTEIETKQFSVIDIITLLSAIPQLQELDISVKETDNGKICFTIGDDVYSFNENTIENVTGYNNNFLM